MRIDCFEHLHPTRGRSGNWLWLYALTHMAGRNVREHGVAFCLQCREKPPLGRPRRADNTLKVTLFVGSQNVMAIKVEIADRVHTPAKQENRDPASCSALLAFLIASVHRHRSPSLWHSVPPGSPPRTTFSNWCGSSVLSVGAYTKV